MRAKLKTWKGWFLGLTSRERLLVGLSGTGLLLYALSVPVLWIAENASVSEAEILRRNRDLADTGALLRRYSALSERLKSLEEQYANSEMTFEQVTSVLDKVVKESIGSDNYELKKRPSGREIGTNLMQQDFTLRIRALSLEQLVKLLHRLEYGDSPLFLGKLDVSRGAGAGGELTATLEVSSIGKKRLTE